MGSLFQNGRVRLNLGGPKYHRLEDSDPWIGLDDDEDDELIHSSSPKTKNPAFRDKDDQFEELTIDVGNEDERFLYDRRMLERQGSPLYRTFVAKKEAACHGKNRRLFCTLLAVLLCFLVVCLIYFLLPCSSESCSSGSEPTPTSGSIPTPSSGSLLGSSPTRSPNLDKSRDFAINVTGGTETTIRLFDVNKDGIDDIIFGYARAFNKLNEDGMRQFCASLNMSVPCAGSLTAVDGRDGTILWEHNLECEVFAIQCGKLDVNEDGQDDCLVAGRLGVLQAIDTTNGTKLWASDPTMTNSSWNFYHPQIVPDLDMDGVPEVVVSHGGNGEYTAEETDRDANRLLLLSGKTGKSLGKNYLETPDQKETYSAVTLYEKEDGATYVLFGTGGETVKGSLWAISLCDLFCHVMGYGPMCSEAAPDVMEIPAFQHANHPNWGNPLSVSPEGAKEILRCDNDKGVMVPTVLADMNQDGTLDLIVSIFNGTVAVLNGHDLSIIWTTGERFGEYETYSTPAPGHFNSDDIPDLMVRLSHGNWSESYNYTSVFILDGRNGRVLWRTDSHSKDAVMASPLSVGGQDNKDAFLFWTQGRNNDAVDIPINMPPHHDVTPQSIDGKPDRRLRRHGHETMNIDCDQFTKQFECELFLLNRDIVQAPLRIAMIEPHEYYSKTPEEQQPTFNPDNMQLRRKRNHDSSNASHAVELPEIAPVVTKVPTSPKISADKGSTRIPTQPSTTLIHSKSNNNQNSDAEVTTAVSDAPDFTTDLKTTPTPQKVKPTPLKNIPFRGYPFPNTGTTSEPYYGNPFEDYDDDADYFRPTTPKPETIPSFNREFNPYYDQINDGGNKNDYNDDDDDIFGHNQGHINYGNESPPDDFREPLDMYPQGDQDYQDEDAPPCFLITSYIRSTGAVGDLDKDGILDIIYLMSFMTPTQDNGDGQPAINKPISTLYKKSLSNVKQDFVRLDPGKTFCDESVKGQPLEDGEEDFGLKVDGKLSKWMGYCGTDGDCRYE